MTKTVQSNKLSRVLVIAPTLDARSGAGRMARELVLRLRERVDLHLLVEHNACDGGFGEQRILETHRHISGFIRNCFRARRAAHGATVVHALDGWPYGVYGLAAVFGTQKKLIISGIGTYSVAPLRIGGLRRLLLLRAYRRAVAIPCISAYTQTLIRNEVPDAKTSIIHLGTTMLARPTEQVRETFKARMKLPPDAFPVLLTVGEIKERKGQLDTLCGLALLAQEYPKMLYLMVGGIDSEYTKNIRDFAKAHNMEHAIRIVTDVGSDEELSAAYESADISILASNNDGFHFEGFGLVFLEAAQFGVPGIGTRNCGIEDAIMDGVSGVLVDQKDHPAIAKAVVRILNNHESFKHGASAQHLLFSWDTTADSLLALYKKASE